MPTFFAKAGLAEAAAINLNCRFDRLGISKTTPDQP
jgi:hypothetical protein